jgi:type VI protein secretion system component Hcp
METTTQIYLEITLAGGGSIEGEASAGGYEGRIDIDSFSFGVSAKKQAVKDAQAGQIKSNLDFDTVTISKVFDRASLQLAMAMADNAEESQGPDAGRKRKCFSEATISVDQQYVLGERGPKYRNEVIIFSLYDGYIVSVKLRTSESGAGASIKEDIELSFHNFEITYYAEDRDQQGRQADRSNWRPLAFGFKTEREVQDA